MCAGPPPRGTDGSRDLGISPDPRCPQAITRHPKLQGLIAAVIDCRNLGDGAPSLDQTGLSKGKTRGPSYQLEPSMGDMTGAAGLSTS